MLEERNRQAREMHDTVIQGCAGVSAVLEAVSDQASAVAVHEDGSAVTADAPARPGELLTVYEVYGQLAGEEETPVSA